MHSLDCARRRGNTEWESKLAGDKGREETRRTPFAGAPAREAVKPSDCVAGAQALVASGRAVLSHSPVSVGSLTQSEARGAHGFVSRFLVNYLEASFYNNV